MKCCLYCDKPIVEEPGQKKFRKDKKFCNQKCHDAHKYEKASKAVKEFRDDYGLNLYTFKGLEKKLALIEMLGGKCEMCGYDKNIAAFDFHHRDGYEKSFEVKIQNLKSKKDEDILEEALKCMILCSNCHREIHNPSLEMNHVKMVLDLQKNK